MNIQTLSISLAFCVALLAGCGEGAGDQPSRTDSLETETVRPLGPPSNQQSASGSSRVCGPATSAATGPQPDKTSIENLFGCVTLTHVSADGQTRFTDTVVFNAASEGDRILGRRTQPDMIFCVLLVLSTPLMTIS